MIRPVILVLFHLGCWSTFAQAKESSSSGPAIHCNKAGLAKADLCGEKLFFVGKNARSFPTTDIETEHYCAETNQLVQCVKRFTDKCSRNDIQRNLANVMLYTVRSHHKSVCGSKSKRSQMVTMSKCANSISKKSTDCMNRMLVEFGQALGLKETKNRVPYACCAYHKMQQCIMQATEKVGKQICSSKATEIFETYISSMAGNTLQLMCNDYEAESDRCNSIRSLPFDNKKARTPKSLLLAFGDLILTDGNGKV